MRHGAINIARARKGAGMAGMGKHATPINGKISKGVKRQKLHNVIAVGSEKVVKMLKAGSAISDKMIKR